MEPAAWVMLVGVWSVIFACTGYCFYKLMRSQRNFNSNSAAAHDEPSAGG